MPPAVLSFLEQLRRLPMGAWAEAVRSAEAAQQPELGGGSLHAAGRARLRRVVEASPNLTARIRTRVYDVVTVLEGLLHRVDVLRMKKAALGAALAVAARPALDPEDFDRLYAPFRALIPLRDPPPNPLGGTSGVRSPEAREQ